MMNEIKDLLKKKAAGGYKPMSKMEQSSKMEMLDELENLADEGIAKKMQKVTVAAPDKEGLKAGLEMAEDKLEGSEESEEEDGMKGLGEQESPDIMDSSLPEMKDDMSEEEIDKLMKHLGDMKLKKING